MIDLVSMLICHFHLTELEAWSLPLLRAFAYQAWFTQCTYPVTLAGDGYIGLEVRRRG